MSGIGARLGTLTPEQLSQLLKSRAQKNGVHAIHARRGPAGDAPLSYAQQRLWFAWQLQPDSSLYNISAAVRLTGRLDAGLLERALDGVVRRHQILRTIFPAEGGEPVQRVLAGMHVAMPVRDVSPEDALRIAGDEARRPFDLARGPLVRALLLRTAPDEHVLMVAIHHIAADGWSIRVLVREMSALYRAAATGWTAPLGELDIQYADYAVWERDQLQGERLAKGLAFWREALQGSPALLELPVDRPRPTVESHRGASLRFAMPAELLEKSARLAQEEHATRFLVLLAAFQALLDRYTGQGDICVGTPVANRPRPETEPLIGLFANTLVIRTNFQDSPTFRELVRRVRKSALDAYAHQDVPFELVAAELVPRRDLSHNPLFQAAFSFEETALQGLDLGGVQAELIEPDRGTAKFDLTLTIIDSPPQPQAVFEYSTDLFDAATIERMAGHFRTLLEAMLDAPEAPVVGLFLLPEAEREVVLEEWSGKAAPAPRGETFHGRFAEQAARTPDAAAVVFNGDSLTYAALNARANRLARYLAGLGVGPDVPVGLCIERSVDVLVGILGILKAGGAYLPLDPAYPKERLTYMLADSHAPVLVTRGASLADSDGLRVVSLDRDAAAIAREADTDFESGADEENLAYIIYTSGSTGRPKGVMIEHRSLLNFALGLDLSMYRDFPGPLRVSLNSALSFDASVFQIVRLLHGDTICIVPERARLDGRELMEFAREHQLDVLDTVPAQLKLLVDSGLAGAAAYRPPLLWTGGEAIDEKTWKALSECADTVLFNAYGPTECTVAATNCSVRSCPEQPSIGRPQPNARVYILDRQMLPVPAGVPGELFIGGGGVGRGYFERPELTAERFVPDPYGDRPGARLYATGDLARWLPDGNISFLGRTDRQVKVHGFRIELGEIESVLRRQAGVRAAVVLARADARGENSLVAYAVPAAGRDRAHAEGLVSVLRDALKAVLPAHMVPSLFVLLDSVPLTPSGKADIAALPSPSEEDRVLPRGSVAPRNPLEQRLAKLWSAVLGLGTAGVEDNFFELGGDSIRAAVFTNRLRQELSAGVQVSWLFRAPTIAEYADVLRRELPDAAARFEQGLQGPSPALGAAPRTGDLPLSLAQERLWVAEQLAGGPLYNIPAAVRLRGELNAEALKRSLNEIVERHEPLRTAFISHNGRAIQRILPQVELGISTGDLRKLPARQREAELRRILAADARAPFDLASPPLLRATLVRLDDREHVLLISVHHLVFDGWSTTVLIREIAGLYEAFLDGRASPLPALETQYADYACWEREWTGGDGAREGVEYWKRRLEGIAPLILPTDRPRPSAPSFRGALHAFEIPQETAERLRRWTRERGATLFMTTLAAFVTLLQRYTGQSDIAVGTPVAGRTRVETENLIGLFVNTVVLRTNTSGAPRFTDLVERVRETVTEAFGHQDTPFELVVDAVAPGHNPSRNPLFQVMFSLEADPVETRALPGLEMTPLHTDSGTSKFDLTLDLVDNGRTLSGTIEYSTELFDPETPGRMAAQFTTLLAAIAADPARAVTELPLLGSDERRRIVSQWNETAAGFRSGVTFHQVFEEQAARTPEATAVRCEDDGLSYGDLNRRANRLAHFLRKQGVGPETRVGLAVERSSRVVAAVLGILKAGGAYVPLDPAYPRERLEYILEDSGASLLLTAGNLAVSCARVLDLDAIASALEREPDENPSATAGPSNIAYVIYTSGSTGQPKGVMVEHGSVVNLAGALDREIYSRLGAGPLRVGLNASFSFDASVEELCALLHGHTLCVIPDEVRLDAAELLAYIRRHQLDVLGAVPAHVKALLSVGLLDGPGYKLPVLIPGGEALDEATWSRLAEARETESFNSYGPTECTVDSTFCIIRGGPSRPAIGKPLANARMYIVDAGMQPQPVGVPGEVHIGGAGLARGYLNRPDLTADRFVPDPFSGIPGARLYRTGDLARWFPDGNAEYLGRTDRQVKVRGFRIELGEVEAVLRRCPGIKDAVVLARDDRPGENRLVAYMAPQAAAAEHAALVAGTRAALKEALPAYMIPSAFVVLEALPRLPSGKLDTAALPVPDGERPEVGAGYVAPRTREEELLAAIWAELLNVDRVGIHDDFFELGGDSILTIQAIARANEAGLRLTPRQLFQRPTIAGLAALAGSGGEISVEDAPVAGPVPLTPVQRWFFEQELPEPNHFNQSVLLEIPGGLDRSLCETALNRLADHHDALRLRFEKHGARWEQRYAPAGQPVTLRWEDLSAIRPEHLDAEFQERCSRVQASLDLSAGPLLGAAYFDFGAARSGRLLVVVHHLVVDAVSWRILLEDLHRVYQALAAGTAPSLPPKTSSFRQWGQALERCAHSEQAHAELNYWLGTLEGASGSLRADSDGENTESSAEQVSVSLDSDSTRRLLEEASRMSRTEVQDVLVTALWRALSQFTGARAVLVDLESHGRAQLEESIDVSRTVGWFTSIYPARLEADPDTWPGGALESIKAELRAVPNLGIGYGALRYLAASEELGSAPRRALVLNYLGQLDRGMTASGSWGAAVEHTGSEHAAGGRRTHAIEVSSWIAGGRLELRWNYSAALHRRGTIEGLAAIHLEAVKEVVSWCCTGGPSETETAAVSQQEIEAFLDELRGEE